MPFYHLSNGTTRTAYMCIRIIVTLKYILTWIRVINSYPYHVQPCLSWAFLKIVYESLCCIQVHQELSFHFHSSLVHYTQLKSEFCVFKYISCGQNTLLPRIPATYNTPYPMMNFNLRAYTCRLRNSILCLMSPASYTAYCCKITATAVRIIKKARKSGWIDNRRSELLCTRLCLDDKVVR